MEQSIASTKDNVEERIKSLAGVSCFACNDTGYQVEWRDGQWCTKFEKTGEVTDHGEKIRLIKCDHGIDKGF